MANRRPIRRGRIPFRRSKRPVRWVDANSSQLAEDTLFLPAGSIFLPALGGEFTQNYRELVLGDVDTSWSDANDVLLERLVGEVSVFAKSFQVTPDQGAESAVFSYAGLVFPVVRMGIVLLEDVDDDNTTPPIPPGLWTADDLRDGEWLWLTQVREFPSAHMYVGEDPGLATVQVKDIHLDLRVKRKIGRRDRLVLCHEFATVGNVGSSNAVDVQCLLRALVSTK